MRLVRTAECVRGCDKVLRVWEVKIWVSFLFYFFGVVFKTYFCGGFYASFLHFLHFSFSIRVLPSPSPALNI